MNARDSGDWGVEDTGDAIVVWSLGTKIASFPYHPKRAADRERACWLMILLDEATEHGQIIADRERAMCAKAPKP